MLPPQSVASEEASSVWMARTSREAAGARGGGGTGPAGVGAETV